MELNDYDVFSMDWLSTKPELWYMGYTDKELREMYMAVEDGVFKQRRAVEYATTLLHMMKERSSGIEREQEFRAQQSMRNMPTAPKVVKVVKIMKKIKKTPKVTVDQLKNTVKLIKKRQRDVKKQITNEKKKKAKKPKSIGGKKMLKNEDKIIKLLKAGEKKEMDEVLALGDIKDSE